jgi:asparagine synthase (glutamine-hydrolysing)
MSRIVGFFSPWPEAKSSLMLDSMLKHFDRPEIKIQKNIKGNCLLGVCLQLSDSKSVAQSWPYSIVIDGNIFSVDGMNINGKSVADIVLKLFEQYGFRDALSKINGDFAIALYDSIENTLWLGRDRVGVKPMYFISEKEFFACASQPGALLRIPGISKELNHQFVGLFAGSHYRTFDNAQNESPFAFVKQLPAAHLAKIKIGEEPRIQAYWHLRDQPDFNFTEQELAEQYRELLLDSVRIRLKQSKSPAFLLSGGMDSSSILASAVSILGQKQQVFSSVYDDRTYDESEEISSMLDGNVDIWHPVKINDLDLFAIVDQMVRIHDEPVSTATWLSHFLLCGKVKDSGFTTLFGGLGGDELNAGEYEHFFYHFADLRLSRKENVLETEVRHWSKYHDHPIYRKNFEVVEEAFKRIVDFNNPGLCLPDRQRIDFYADAINPNFFDIRSYIPVMDTPFNSYLKNRTYQDIFRETAPCCLRAEDRHSNAFGLQHFDPFFDKRLIEFMFRIPGSMKIRDGVTKILLREATKGLLPETTRTRVKKTGWNAPAHLWFSGKNLANLKEITNSREFKDLGIYNWAYVQNVINRQEQSITKKEFPSSDPMFLWQLLSLFTWIRSVSTLNSQKGLH